MTRIALLLLLLLLPQAVLAAGGEQLSFADSLAAEGDHYRAITEYKRFLHQHPQDGLAPKARLAIARSLLAGQRWDQADRALELVMELHPATQEATAAGRAYADSAFERGDYGLARSRYRRLLEQGNDAEQRQRARYRIGWTFLEEGQLSEAKGAFGKLEPDLAAELLPALDRYQELPQKSPRLAGALSALLPGAGQLYTGRVKQAGLALALNATFLYGA